MLSLPYVGFSVQESKDSLPLTVSLDSPSAILEWVEILSTFGNSVFVFVLFLSLTLEKCVVMYMSSRKLVEAGTACQVSFLIGRSLHCSFLLNMFCLHVC